MRINRRNFIKATAGGMAGLALGQVGFDLAQVKAYAYGLKIEGAKEFITVCPFCSCGCNIIAHVKNGKIVSTEGDPDYPVSEGGLCAKGAALLSMHDEGHRVKKPLYRAPYSDKWEEKDWDWVLDRIARRIKDTRDRHFKRFNDKGQEVNRVEAIFQLGTSQMDNEECSVAHQMLRGLGVVHLDHQARICHSATVPALAESFGRGAMTNHWIDIQNANAILIMGGKAAENHPISFKWVLKAQDKGATVMHVDPVFGRTSARADFHVPLRSGTDIAFLGGMISYILEHEKYFKEYVTEYTNAAFVVSKGFGFKDGLFTGYDAKTRKYDRSTWTFDKDENGVPVRDKSLKHPRCVLQLLKKHYSRYTPSRACRRRPAYPRTRSCACTRPTRPTGAKDKAGTIMYALGWTQHTVGVQNIRTSAMVQLLLGNIGVAGGGINALRGEPNVQGSTDQAILWHILPGYNPVPKASQPDLATYLKASTPVSNDPMSANWWQHRPKYMISYLKSYYGDNATADNGYCYNWLPKCDDGEDYSYLFLTDRMYKGEISGGFVFAHNPCQSIPNTHKTRRAFDNLDWLVVGEIHHTETTDNWHRPGVDPASVKTEVFLLPSSQRGEKEGSVTNSGRWVLWHYMCQQPIGESRDMGAQIVDVVNRVRHLYATEDGVFPRPGPGHGLAKGLQRRKARHDEQRLVHARRHGQGQGLQEGRPGAQLHLSHRRRGHCLHELAVLGRLSRARAEPGQAARPVAETTCRPTSGCSPTSRGAGPSTAASSTTAPPWTPTASPTTPPSRSFPGTGPSGWATSPTAAGRRLPRARGAIPSSCIPRATASSSGRAAWTAPSPSTTSPWKPRSSATGSRAS